MAYWAAAQTQAQHEAVAQHFLGLAGFECYLPRLRVPRVKRGRKIETRPPLFPGYVFVSIANGCWWSARWCPHVVRLVSAGDGPAHVADAIVDELKGRERGGLIDLPKPPGLQAGDRVRILSGPFAGHFGLFAGMKPRERVEVLLTILGGQVRAELAKAAVEPVRS
jgi:transcriptional antiterminator RfaH